MASLLVGGCNSNRVKPLFSFGVIADIQYADKPVVEGRNRFEKDAINKLTATLKYWHNHHTSTSPLKCVINLGDIIDGHKGDDAFERDVADLQLVMQAFESVPIPHYHVLGNHCVYNLGCDYVARRLKMPHRYYDIEMEKGWRFVFLDGTDLSLMKDSRAYDEAKVYFQENIHRNLEDWNGGFSKGQLQWLTKVFSHARQNGEKLIMFCHWPLINLWDADYETALLWNATEVLDMLDPEVVFMFMSGHMHDNGYVLHRNIHHVTLDAVVTTPAGGIAHAIVNVYDDKVEIEGFGTVAPLSKSFVFGPASLSPPVVPGA